MNLSKAQWLVLREVSKSEEGLIAYTLHRRLSVTARQLVSIINDLVRRGYVDFQSEDNRVILNNRGMEIMQSLPSKKRFDTKEVEKAGWIHRPQIAINSPYIPRTSLK